LAGGFAIDEPVGGMSVEFDHPTADDPHCHVADLRRFRMEPP
jgi:hypothetical protein